MLLVGLDTCIAELATNLVRVEMRALEQ
jgi:hypothetical protein